MKNKTISIILVIITVLSVCALSVSASDQKGYLVITDYVKVNSGKDVSADIQKVIDENPHRTIFFPDGEYLIGSPVLTPADPRISVSLKLADYAVLKATSEWKKGEAIVQLGGKNPYNSITINGSNYYFEGGIIDGSHVADGISINSGRETGIRNVSIKNTIIGIHILHGANSGSSDADIMGVNIVGCGNNSTGVLCEGFDNTFTNMRIANVFTGIHLKSSGNMLRNIHPLFTSGYENYENSCGFIDESGTNWFDYCYSDQFGIGFKTTGNSRSTFNDCFCYWYSPNGKSHTAFLSEGKFNSVITNFNIGGFKRNNNNAVLICKKLGGNGVIENLSVRDSDLSTFAHKAYLESHNIFELTAKIFWKMINVFYVIFG